MSNNIETPIMENVHVKDFMSILRENGKDIEGFLKMLGHVTAMEHQLNKAVDDLSAMRRELAGMREERDHPVRAALEKAARSLEATISETRSRLAEIKKIIVEGCKNAATSFREKGAAALNGIVKFFRIKPALESMRGSLQNNIKRDQAAIDRIGDISKKYHAAGMHVRNAGRTLRGKKPLVAVKPNGKLAKLIAAPYRAEMNALRGTLADTEKAIAALERLEKATPHRAAEEERNEVGSKADGKVSFKAAVKKYQEKAKEESRDAPTKVKVRRKEAEL